MQENMKRIMFNETYGLQEAVLRRRKTMTRRFDEQYHVGDIVAIAQRYSEIWRESPNVWRRPFVAKSQRYSVIPSELIYDRNVLRIVDQKNLEAGWNNKMFVKAELMPHHIRITDVKVEHLQDITEESCLREGIQEYFPYKGEKLRTFQYFKNGKIWHRISPATKCFALLIDDICGKGTWDSNPLVYAYSFELVD